MQQVRARAKRRRFNLLQFSPRMERGSVVLPPLHVRAIFESVCDNPFQASLLVPNSLACFQYCLHGKVQRCRYGNSFNSGTGNILDSRRRLVWLGIECVRHDNTLRCIERAKHTIAQQSIWTTLYEAQTS